MPDNLNPQSNSVPQPSEAFGTVPYGAERFGNLPNSSASFGTIPQLAERKAKHTLTVHDAARMFEAAGVSRTERSITNWCQSNKGGVPRLDAYFDPNERKYFLTPESVERAIAEEKAKAARTPPTSEAFGTIPKASERPSKTPSPDRERDADRVRELEKEVMDLKITNRGKDFFIEVLQKEREGFADERQDYVAKLMSFNRKVGELETKLHQIEAPSPEAKVETYQSEIHSNNA